MTGDRLLGTNAARRYIQVYHPDMNISGKELDQLLKEWEKTNIPFGQFVKMWRLK